MQRTALTCLLCCAPLLAWAGTNSWTALGPAGGSITNVVFSPAANTVFAIGESGVYRSVNGGVSWQSVKSDFVSSPQGIAVDPSNSERVYVVAPNSPALFASTDGGATFQAVGTLPVAVTQAWQVAVGLDGQTLYVTSGARVFHSSNRGQSWTERTAVGTDPLARVIQLVLDPTDANTAYASATLSASLVGALRTQDGGQTWQTLYSGAPTTSSTYYIAVAPTAPMQVWAARMDGLWRSMDRGATWTNVLPEPGVSAVAIDPTNAAVIHAGTAFGKVMRSADRGANWPLETTRQYAGQITSLAVDPARSPHVLLSGLAGISASEDGGATWVSRNAGLLGSSIGALSVDPTTGRVYVNAQHDGVYYLSAGTTTLQSADNIELRALQSGDPNQPSSSIYITAMLATPGHLFASVTRGLARSLDGGNDWGLQQIVPGNTSQQLFNLANSPVAPLSVVATSRSTVLRSTDGGASWLAFADRLPNGSEMTDLLVAPSDGQRAYGLVYRSQLNMPTEWLGLYRSFDGGTTWSAAGNASSPLNLLAVDPSAPGTLYGTTDTALVRSTDSGASWVPLNWSTSQSGYVAALVIDAQRPETLYAAGSRRVVRSVDAGTTWETLRSSAIAPTWSPNAALIDAARPSTLFVGTNSHGVQMFTVAPDTAVTGTAPTAPVGLDVPFTLTFNVVNQGPFDATGAVVQLRWPATAVGVTVAVPGGSCVVSATSASCLVPVLRVLTPISVVVSAQSAPAGPFSVESSATADQPDPVTENNVLMLTAQVAARADLSVSASGSTSARIGDAVTYTLAARNAGPNGATAPTLTFQLAAGLRAGAVTASAGSCSTSPSGLVTCTLGDLAANTTSTVTVSANATVAGEQVSIAALASLTADGASADNNASVSTTVAAPPSDGGGGGGGGGAFSWLDLLALCLLACGYFLSKVASHSSSEPSFTSSNRYVPR